MLWWTWISVGFVLLGTELFIPSGFYLFIIGMSCFVVGGLTYANIIESQNTQFLIAGLVGILQLFTIRKPLYQAMKSLGKNTGSDITHQKVTASEDIQVGATGKGELAGSSWNVKNDSHNTLQKNQVYAVHKIEGLTLIVK